MTKITTNKADTEFYCTSKYLAERLACQGYTARPTTNIYRQDRPAWIFELTPESAQIIANYFTKMEKPVPVVVKDFLKAAADLHAEGE